MTAWTCSVCGTAGAGVAQRCQSCNSIACASCLRASTCTNCQIEDGDRWFAPAAEDPIGGLPRRWPLGLIALVVFGPVLIAVVAEMMGRIQSPARPHRTGTVHFIGEPAAAPARPEPEPR